MSRTPSPRVRIALVTAALVLGLPGIAGADNRFQEHRERLQQGQIEVVRLEGRVLGPYGGDRLRTDISPQRLAALGVGDLDNVWVRIAQHRMPARVMTEASFQRLSQGGDGVGDLDVDIICLVQDMAASTGLEIVGLGGGLVDWIQPHEGMGVIIEKERF